MNELLLQTLYLCVEQCEQLERLLDQDAEDMSSCITGEVFEQYRQLIGETKAKVDSLKNELRNKHNEIMSIM